MLHKARPEDYEAIRVIIDIASDCEESFCLNIIIKGAHFALQTIDWGKEDKFTEEQIILQDEVGEALEKIYTITNRDFDDSNEELNFVEKLFEQINNGLIKLAELAL